MFNPNIETGNKVNIFGLSLHLLHLKLSASNPSANFAGDWPFFDFEGGPLAQGEDGHSVRETLFFVEDYIHGQS